MSNSSMLQRSRLALGLAIALAAAPAFAQQTSSSLGGLVVGADGNPIAGASVLITHTPSGTISRAITDANGRYAARGLRVGGPYSVLVIADGFQSKNSENVFLQLAKTGNVSLFLDPAAQQLEEIAVVAAIQSDVFNPGKMGTTTNVGQRELNAFPSVNRNIQDYVRLDPRIAQTDKARNEISAGGQNTRYNAIRIDGVSTSDTFGLEANSLPTPRQPISMDAIEAIDISIANYDVTIGGATGAVVNAVTKSGTNDFAGSVYGLYRDNDWSGENPSGVKPTLFDNQQTLGGTFGGPLIEDTLFFFINYEEFTGKDLFDGFGANSGPIGSGAASIVNISQADINDALAVARDVWGFDPGDLSRPALDTETEELGLKIDWNINDYHRAYLRYTKSDQSRPNLVGYGSASLSLGSYNYVRDFELESITGQLFSDWTDSFNTEAKISFRDYSAVRTPFVNLPSINIRVGNAFLNMGTEENTHANILETETWNAYFVGTWFVGDHEVKAGLDYEENDIYNLFGRRTNGVYNFDCIRTSDTCANSFESGRSSRYQYFYPAGGDLDNMAAAWTYENLALFVQDTWSVNYNLTVTAGLRWDEPSIPDSPTYNATASNAFGYDNSATIDGNGLFQPRLGFNYTFDSERPMQLRGGLGLFQGAAATVWMSNPYSNNGLAYTDYFFSRGITQFSPDPADQLGLFTPGAGATQSVDFIDPDLGQPSVWKANLAFEHELPWYGLVGSAEVVLTSVEEGIFYQQLNLGAPTAVGQDGRMIYWNANGLNPTRWNQQGVGNSVTARANRLTNFNDAIIARSTGKGDGQQMTLSLQKPFTENWYWQLSYTYTDAKEVGSNTSSTSSSQLGNSMIFQANEEVASRSNYVIRDRFTAALSYRHFFFEGYKTEISGFYEGRKGKPFSYSFDNDANGDGRLNDLLYIPAGRGDVLFGSAAEEEAFWAFVNSNEYLRTHLGQVAERNGDFSSWVNQFDIRISQELPGFFEGNKAEIWVDILNVGNMINKDWGQIDEVPFPLSYGVVEYGGIDPNTGKYVYRFNTPDSSRLYDDNGISRWALQVGFRYNF